MERDVVHVCLFGDVDTDTVGEIREQFETSTAWAERVVLDLSGVTFLDPAGLDLVLQTDAAARADGWELRLIGAPADVQRVFDLTGARARLPFLTARQLSALLTTPGIEPT
jgi:anti-anti-sigma factor